MPGGHRPVVRREIVSTRPTTETLYVVERERLAEAGRDVGERVAVEDGEGVRRAVDGQRPDLALRRLALEVDGDARALRAAAGGAERRDGERGGDGRPVDAAERDRVPPTVTW